MMQKASLALGSPPLPVALKWNFDDRRNTPQECCVSHPTHSCRALIAIRSSLWGQPGHAAILAHLYELMREEWRERFDGFPLVDHDSLRVWFMTGVLHANPAEFRFGRLTPHGDFVTVEPGQLADLFSLDDYRGER